MYHLCKRGKNAVSNLNVNKIRYQGLLTQQGLHNEQDSGKKSGPTEME